MAKRKPKTKPSLPAIDPQACLITACECISDEPESTAEHLQDYREWRAKGGFEPTIQAALLGSESDYKGDELAAELEEIISVLRGG